MKSHHQATIELAAVAKQYGSHWAVREASLDVNLGEVVGLLGANGAGKTTLMRIVCGLVKPSAGVVAVMGARPPLPPMLLRHVGAMLDTPAFYRWMTGAQLLTTLLNSAGQADDGRVAAVLDRVGLGSAGRKRIRAYSMGMRQRLALATALVKSPKVLILDEPTNGLDPDGVRLVRDILAEERMRGTAILVSSHQMDEMQRICDRVAVMADGQTIATGTLAEIGLGVAGGPVTLEDWFFAVREAR